MAFEENESLGNETETQDEVTGGTSSASEDQGSGETAQAAAPKQEDTTDWAKAFEHPRFKELVEQKNQALSGQQELQKQLAALEAKFSQYQQPQGPSKEQAEAEALVEDLKKIDPRLANQIAGMMKANSTMQQLQSKLEGFEKQAQEEKQQAIIQQAVGRINSLHESNKVSPEVKELVNMKLDSLWRSQQLNQQNLDAEYTKALGEYNKMIDTIKRAERESYVAGKKKDALVPTSQPKGEPARNNPKKPSYSKDPEVRNAQIVSRYMKELAAEKGSS